MLELSTTAWIIVATCAAMAGFSKTGIPGGGILIVPLLAWVIPARESVGFLLPMLCVADLMAILIWRRHAIWSQLARLIPWALAGVIIGFFLLRIVNSQQLMPIIGIVVLALLGLTAWRNKHVPDDHIPTHWAFSASMGLLAGITTMMANAAGPVMIIYLLAMRFNKEQFLGTRAWYFFIMNLLKLPFGSSLGLITIPSLLTNLALLPAIITGGILGILLVNRIPARAFKITVTSLAVISSLALIVKGASLYFS